MKVAIITRNSNPWVYFLISRLSLGGVDIIVFDEIRDLSKAPWNSMRFIRRRGIAAFADLYLQQSVARIARLKHSIRGDRTDRQQPSSDKPFDVEHPHDFHSTLAAIVKERMDQIHGVEWHRVTNINSKETTRWIQAAAPDYKLLCGAPLIKMSRFALLEPLINAHCGIPPKYKGSSPTHWACYNRDWDNIGFTLHIATAEVDGGPIIHQERFHPQYGWTLTDLDWFLVYSMYSRLSELVLNNSLGQMISTAKPQPEEYEALPPMGLIRSRIASRRLKCFLASK